MKKDYNEEIKDEPLDESVDTNGVEGPYCVALKLFFPHAIGGNFLFLIVEPISKKKKKKKEKKESLAAEVAEVVEEPAGIFHYS